MPKSCRQTRHAGRLETVSVDVPEEAVEVFEAALASACDTVGLFRDHATGTWRVEGVRAADAGDGGLEAALLLASELSGIEVPVRRDATVPDGWLARSYASFPEQRIGRRFAVRGTHHRSPPASGRITLTLDAGLAFGSGEHGSTRGCIRALEVVARRRPSRILDLGTGSGILAMAAASLLRRAVLATDVEPWSIWVAQRNVTLNRLGRLVTVRLAARGGAASRALRPGVRQYFGAPTLPNGAQACATPFTWRNGDPLGPSRASGARGSHGASALWPQAGGNHAGRALGDAAYASTCRRSQ